MKRNTKVGPQLQGRVIFDPDWKRAWLFLIAFFVGMQVATQVAAHQMGYSPLLGLNLFRIYPTWDYWIWANKWSEQDPNIFKAADGCGQMAGLFVAVVVLLDIARHNFRVNPFLHGSARWADKRDIQRASLINNDGVYVGGWKDKWGKVHYLRHAGPEHVLCYAPTRSGQGRQPHYPDAVILEGKRVRD